MSKLQIFKFSFSSAAVNPTFFIVPLWYVRFPDDMGTKLLWAMHTIQENEWTYVMPAIFLHMSVKKFMESKSHTQESVLNFSLVINFSENMKNTQVCICFASRHSNTVIIEQNYRCNSKKVFIPIVVSQGSLSFTWLAEYNDKNQPTFLKQCQRLSNS